MSRELFALGARARLILSLLLPAALGLLLAGCPSNSTRSSSTPPVAHTAVFGGAVFGGRQPIECSTVTAYAATTGGGLQATIGTGTTGGDGTNCAVGAGAGNFSFTFSPVPASGQIVYVVVNGGYAVPASGIANSAIKLMTVAGTYCTTPGCGFPDNVNINERTTVAAAYSMAGFIALPGGGAVNLTGKSPGLPNAAKIFASLVNAANGKATVSGATGCTGTGEPVNCDALRRLNTLANIVAACVNTNGPPDTACADMFTDTMPTAGVIPTDTLAALFNIVTVPEIRNKGGTLFGLAPTPGIYSPSLTAAPNAWILALNIAPEVFPDNAPNLSIDAGGNIWVVNYDSYPPSPMVAEYDSTGVFLFGVNGGGGLDFAIGLMAFDTNGDFWVVNQSDVPDYGLTKFDYTGAPVSTTARTGGGLGRNGSLPSSMAIDPEGNVWAANGYDNTISEFDHTGAPVSGANGYTGPGLVMGNTAQNIVADAAGNIWVTICSCGGPSGVTKFTPVTDAPPAATLYVNNDLDYVTGAAVDPDGNIWITNLDGGPNSTGFLAKFDPDTEEWHEYTGGGLDYPDDPFLNGTVAVDAGGNVWVTNDTPSISEFDSNGLALSPDPGAYGAGGLAGPSGIAIDPSGNVWVVNYYGGNLTVLIGAAKPTRTPLISAIVNGFTP